MRRSTSFATAILFALVGAVLVAQQVTAPADLDATMKRVGPAAGAANKAVMSAAYADAKAQVAIIRTGVMEAEAFFASKKREDGVKFAKDVLLQVAEYDKLLSAPAPDQMAIQAVAKQMQGACAACHMVYRVRDEAMNWILKPGSVN